MDGLIYVVGGGDGNEWLCSVEVHFHSSQYKPVPGWITALQVYDPKKNVWRSIADLSAKRWKCGLGKTRWWIDSPSIIAVFILTISLFKLDTFCHFIHQHSIIRLTQKLPSLKTRIIFSAMFQDMYVCTYSWTYVLPWRTSNFCFIWFTVTCSLDMGIINLCNYCAKYHFADTKYPPCCAQVSLS